VWKSGPEPEDRGPRVGACSGPDGAGTGPGVYVLSWMSAGVSQLSKVEPVKVVKVEQPGGQEHRVR
jgi:hypothetical protein